MTHEIECPQCGGEGFDIAVCAACNGEGWRPMTEDELSDAAERQAEEASSEPPVTLAEQHRAAWGQKQELRR